MVFYGIQVLKKTYRSLFRHKFSVVEDSVFILEIQPKVSVMHIHRDICSMIVCRRENPITPSNPNVEQTKNNHKKVHQNNR